MNKKISVKNETCPVARSLEVIGDSWSILIIRDLYKKKGCKYIDLQQSLSGVSPNLLSSRLKKLESVGIIFKTLYSEHPPRYEYKLTEKGNGLTPLLKSLWDWGNKFTKTQ